MGFLREPNLYLCHDRHESTVEQISSESLDSSTSRPPLLTVNFRHHTPISHTRTVCEPLLLERAQARKPDEKEPADFPRHPSAEDLIKYYQAYARHFGILDKIIFNVTVKSVVRDEARCKWILTLEDQADPWIFDKVVFAAGSENVPKMPNLEGLDLFQGQFLHGQAYKR